MQFLQIKHMVVDVSRGHLHKHGKIQTLEPRVLDVLLMLARHQGEVVTHEALLKEVWPRAVVENNALQRCIGQLRKAFDDNGRDQHLIVTYPRKGYSLNQTVTWHGSFKPLPEAEKNSRSYSQYSFASLAAGMGLFLLAGLYFVANPFTENVDDGNLRPAENLSLADAGPTNESATLAGIPINLVQSDFYAIYAPDNFLVVYPRAEDETGSQLWVRNVLDGLETRVSEKAGNYQYSAWSPASNQLAYVLENGCYSLYTQDINQNNDGSFSPSIPRTLLDCQPPLLSPQWLSDTTLALVEAQEQETVITLFDVTSLEKRVIYRNTEKMPYHLSYSAESESLAVAQYSKENILELILLYPETGETELLYSAETTPGKNMAWHPVWNQDGTAIMISDQGRTLNIALDGTIREQVVPFISAQQGSI